MEVNLTFPGMIPKGLPEEVMFWWRLQKRRGAIQLKEERKGISDWRKCMFTALHGKGGGCLFKNWEFSIVQAWKAVESDQWLLGRLCRAQCVITWGQVVSYHWSISSGGQWVSIRIWDQLCSHTGVRMENTHVASKQTWNLGQKWYGKLSILCFFSFCFTFKKYFNLWFTQNLYLFML